MGVATNMSDKGFTVFCFQGCLDMSVVQQMTAAFRQKVDTVCKAHCGMAARCLATYIQGKLQMVTERDPLTKDVNVVMQPQVMDQSACLYGL